MGKGRNNMFTIETASQIQLLVTLCFSALILGMGFALNRGQSRYMLIHAAFLFPLWIGIFSFFSVKQNAGWILIQFSEPLLVVAFLLLMTVKPQNFKSAQTAAMIVAPLFAVVLFVQPMLSLSATKQYILVCLTILVSLINLYNLRKAKGLENLLFWSFLCIIASGILGSLWNALFLTYLSHTFKTAAYAAFLVYVYKAGYQRLMAKTQDAEKKLSDFNRTVEMEVKKRVFQLQLSNEKLVNISKTDKLTDAYNKAAILDLIETQTLQKGTEFSILMFDIDLFKQINDSMGHIEGDKCIKKLALLSKQCIRDMDSLGRYGGDEFIILLPNTSEMQARVIAERFRKKVDETNAPHFTVSIGIATFPGNAVTTREMIAVADEQMYVSKNRGRNTISYRNM